MPRSGPRREAVAVRMSAEQIAALRKRAERDGVDVSEIVRRAVDAYLADDPYKGLMNVEVTYNGVTFPKWVLAPEQRTPTRSPAWGPGSPEWLRYGA